MKMASICPDINGLGRSFVNYFAYLCLLLPTSLKILPTGIERSRETIDETPSPFETQLSPIHSITWLSIFLVECLNWSQNISSQIAEGLKLDGIRGYRSAGQVERAPCLICRKQEPRAFTLTVQHAPCWYFIGVIYKIPSRARTKTLTIDFY